MKMSSGVKIVLVVYNVIEMAANCDRLLFSFFRSCF